MKTSLMACLLALTRICAADTATYVYTASGFPAAIPDNNPNGYQNSLNVSGVPSSIIDVTLTLNITGGFNGDLYVALDYNGASTVVLNRAGLSTGNNLGYPDSGFNITLNDSAASDIHFYQSGSYALNGNGQLTGQWQPDGRLISPLSSGSDIAEAPRGNMLSAFDGMDANGTWTLFAADVSPGGVSTLAGWSLEITATPEPGALAIIGCAGACGWLSWKRRRYG